MTGGSFPVMSDGGGGGQSPLPSLPSRSPQSIPESRGAVWQAAQFWAPVAAGALMCPAGTGAAWTFFSQAMPQVSATSSSATSARAVQGHQASNFRFAIFFLLSCEDLFSPAPDDIRRLDGSIDPSLGHSNGGQGSRQASDCQEYLSTGKTKRKVERKTEKKAGKKAEQRLSEKTASNFESQLVSWGITGVDKLGKARDNVT